MSEVLSNLVSGAIGALVATVISLIFSNRFQSKMARVSEVRHELEEAYGPIYSMVSQPETMMTIGSNEETRVPITLVQKNELDRIMTTRPHVFPNNIVVYWRVNIAALTPALTKDKTERYGLKLDFRLMVYEQYKKRLEEYYGLMDRKEELKKLPDWYWKL
jgi:hypothetical protein